MNDQTKNALKTDGVVALINELTSRPTESAKRVAYTASGLRIAECLEDARALRDESNTPEELMEGIKALADKLSILWDSYTDQG